jgi:hypothetical protein
MEEKDGRTDIENSETNTTSKAEQEGKTSGFSFQFPLVFPPSYK